MTLAGDAVQDGRVSVSLFAKTIQSVQEIVFQIAGARLKREMRGRIPAIIKAKCELFLVKTEPGSLNAVLELPGKEATLFPDEVDFSEDVIEDMQRAIEAILEVDDVKLEQILPQPFLRRRVVSRIRTIAPADGSDYRLSFRFNGGPPKTLIRPTKESMYKLAAITAELEEREEPVPKFVEAKGMAQLEDDGNIKKWIETFEVKELELNPDHVWRPQKIRTKGKVFHLTHRIACVIEKQDDLFFSEDTNLGIIAYGETREDVIRAFSNEFEVLWDVIAQEEDNLLTQDALLLKRYVLQLVRKVEKYGDAEITGDQTGID